MDAKIIIFEDRETNDLYIKTDFDCEIMDFSRGFNDDPDMQIELETGDTWEFGGIHSQKMTDIDIIWKLGKQFNTDPEKIHKEEQRRQLVDIIDKTQKLLTQYEKELEKL